MPRSAFFSKEAIAAAGLEIIRKQGVEALTARALSKQLGCSLSPIFTVFKDMDEIQTAVRQAASALPSRSKIFSNCFLNGGTVSWTTLLPLH